MTKQQIEDLAIGFDEYGFEPTILCDIESVVRQYQNAFKEILKDYERLYEIDNAKPSEAMECLEDVSQAPSFMGGNPKYYYAIKSEIPFMQDINTIKQALHKLKQYDDLMGKYNIKNIKELEKILERDRFNAIGKSIQYCKNEVVK